MIFTVLWRPLSEGQLAQLWMDAPDRDFVSAAADEIDSLLRRDPQLQGESREGDARILIVPPLVALFEVNEEDRLVHVLEVWRPQR
jgi:hypothetical protein